MNKEIIELAIRSPKTGVNEIDFIKAKNEAVKKLVSIEGVGPEREFEPFSTSPQKTTHVFVGMTRYKSQSKVYRSMMSVGFMMKLMKFMKLMQPIAGIFMKPDNKQFDYTGFADKENIVEIALLRPKEKKLEEFLAARKKFLAALDAEPEVKMSYTFTVTGGFVAKDTFPHITVYKNRAEFDSLMTRAKNLKYWEEFIPMFDTEILCFCSVIK